MGKRVGECTPEEITAYNDAARDRELTIIESIGKLTARNLLLTEGSEERDDNTGKIADLTKEFGTFQSTVDAFNESNEAINPPTQPQLDSIKAQLKAVNKLTAGRRVLEAVVVATKEAARIFSEIQPAPG